MSVGEINGAEINRLQINGGVVVIIDELAANIGVTFDQNLPISNRYALAADMSLAFDQSAETTLTHVLSIDANMDVSFGQTAEMTLIHVLSVDANMSVAFDQTAELTLIHVLSIESNMGVSFGQTAEFVRVRLLEPYGITSFQSSLQAMVKTQSLASDGGFNFDSLVQQMVKSRFIETAGDIQFAQLYDLELIPPLALKDTITFVSEADLGHNFFGHWFDGVRMTVLEEDRGLRVPEEYRLIGVPPDPEPAPRIVWVPQQYRRILVPRDPDELVPQKDREVFA